MYSTRSAGRVSVTVSAVAKATWPCSVYSSGTGARVVVVEVDVVDVVDVEVVDVEVEVDVVEVVVVEVVDVEVDELVTTGADVAAAVVAGTSEVVEVLVADATSAAPASAARSTPAVPQLAASMPRTTKAPERRTEPRATSKRYFPNRRIDVQQS